MTDEAEPEGYEGIWDDVQTALKWKPVLPLLQKLEAAKSVPDRISAVRHLAEFIIRTGFDTNPYNVFAYLMLVKVENTVRQDDEWQAIIKRLAGQ